MYSRYRLILVLITSTLAFQTNSIAQNLDQFKNTIDTLCSKYMGGRGYVEDGDIRAAQYLQAKFESLGLKKYGDDYTQEFPIPINTFPGKTDLKINGKQLVIGKDFIISPNSCGGEKALKTFSLKEKHLSNPQKFVKNKKRHLRTLIYKDSEYRQLIEKHFESGKSAKKYAELSYTSAIQISSTKLTASMAQRQDPNITFIVDEKAVTGKIKKVEYNIDAKFKPDYVSQNVVGYIEGSTYADSIIVIGGHYDHLGYMGNEAYFPGANDNASGVAMILELAEYFTKNKPEMTMVFIAFGGEEVGLVGSKYFCENPYFDLSKIKFMFSLDLFGAGSKGITAVNGTVLKDDFKLLQQVNDAGKYLPKVKSRKPTANSDHYFFYKNGVPSFFLYTLGDLTAYHDIYDKANILEYDQFEPVFALLKDYITALDQSRVAMKYKAQSRPNFIGKWERISISDDDITDQKTFKKIPNSQETENETLIINKDLTAVTSIGSGKTQFTNQWKYSKDGDKLIFRSTSPDNRIITNTFKIVSLNDDQLVIRRIQ